MAEPPVGEPPGGPPPDGGEEHSAGEPPRAWAPARGSSAGNPPLRVEASPPLEPGGDLPARPGGNRPLTVQRLFGLDRSGPPPRETRRGAPLRPWTIPNAIGFVRLALIPVFLVVALSSDDGRDATSAALFAVIGWGDYADGIAARVTRQYSRLGALMDPVTDRLLVISGVVVTWHFNLLPRWALAVLALRELLMLVLGRVVVGRGLEIQINWPGRLSVAPIMSSFFFAMVGLETLAKVLLLVGLALSLLATALYAADVSRRLRRLDPGRPTT